MTGKLTRCGPIHRPGSSQNKNAGKPKQRRQPAPSGDFLTHHQHGHWNEPIGHDRRDNGGTAGLHQFHGGMGYVEENWPARFFRDTRLWSIGGGADEVMLRTLARMNGILPG